ncbi:MAG TPA: SDR family NAD(P)-dependent oxidoreductase [Burkholderiaceae bacterium]|nr:SDR family NAD(P)-dependent oxidoreductase [Burkholderiaceae bacterium]
MQDFVGRTAVITGAASGFGREFARLARLEGMRLVLADIEPDALDALVAELGGKPDVIGAVVDVSDAEQVQGMAARAQSAFGAIHLLFNNAGVSGGGYVWENTQQDWQWVLGVNLMGVVHGLRCFVPPMLETSRAGEPAHIVNTASVAGWVSAPLMGIYSVSKHAVVTLTETLHQDLRLAGAKIGVTLLSPAFVPTGIVESERNRPARWASHAPASASQRAAQAQVAKAIESGRLSAAQVARMTFDAIRADRFYVFTHPRILPSLTERVRHAVEGLPPADPYESRPQSRPRVG